MDAGADCGAYVIPDQIRRHRKLIRCLHPWRLSVVYSKNEPLIITVVDEHAFNRGVLFQKNWGDGTNTEKLIQLVALRDRNG
jgi:hypothetical protein